MSPRRQLPLSLEYILLGFLDQAPIHGYDLHKKVAGLEGVALVWRVKRSQLYALLEKLEADGLLTSTFVPGEAHLLRRQYQITSVGRQTFYAWRTSPVSHSRDMRQEFLAKLYFAQKAGIEIGLELIDEQRTACLEWLADCQVSYARTGAEQQYERMVFQFRISQIEAMLAWLDYCQFELQGRLPAHASP